MSLWGDACRFCQQARWLIIALLTGAFITWGFWGWREIARWYEDDAPVISFGNGEAAQSVGYPGEVIVFYQTVRKHRDCAGQIQRVMTGACGHIVTSETHSTLKAGFEGRLTLPEASRTMQKAMAVLIAILMAIGGTAASIEAFRKWMGNS